jgi:hypothetical protein
MAASTWSRKREVAEAEARYADDGTVEAFFETVRPAGTRVTAVPLVPLETLVAETEVQASPVP